jgi:cell division protein FtsI (penicillin-binding protein 3)
MMEAVVTDGTGKRAQIAHYRVAGKTGTSEKIGPDGRYSKALVTSFIGILTVDRPRYVVLAMFDEPQGGSGGLVAAPVVKEVMEAVIAIEQIPPVPAVSP